MKAIAQFDAIPQPRLLGHDAETPGGWVHFLESCLEQDWHPTEWNQTHWLFKADPDNPETRVYHCISAACDHLSDTRDGYCVSCREILREVGGDPDALATRLSLRSHKKMRASRSEICLVEQESVRCARTVSAHGLCQTHLKNWQFLLRRGRDITVAEYTRLPESRPLNHLGWCLVEPCERARTSSQTLLCTAHEKLFKRQNSRVTWANDRANAERTFAKDQPPIHTYGSFCLLPLPEEIRYELLVALQAEGRAGYTLNPMFTHRIVPILAEAATSLADPAFDAHIPSAHARGDSVPAFLRRASLTIRSLRGKFDGVDPTAGDVWDSFEVGLPSAIHQKDRGKRGNERKFVTKRRAIDFTPIRQTWLRELAKLWVREVLPPTCDAHDLIKGFATISDAVALRSDSDNPAAAQGRDIQKALELLHTLKRSDGTVYSAVSISKYWSLARRALHYLRAAGHMDHIHPGFAITPDHRIRRSVTRPDQDRPGRALPYRVVNALLAALSDMPESRGQLGSFITDADLTYMHKTALRVLIDTGRRPGEVVSLKVGCVIASPTTTQDPAGVEYTLTYDNHKSGRQGRTIPITADTANIIMEWETYRKALELPTTFDGWLFPSPSAGRADADRHLTTRGLARALDHLVASIPRLESDVPNTSTGGYVQYAEKILLYSLRHSYAQRHADAGVDPDALRELMDHNSVTTTMGYYKVSAKRKREAIAKLAPLAVDQHGDSTPFDSPVAYEIRSVAVPFGGCTEPTNVKAGGKACAIRFQCAGCAAYRPDPSYIPAIEEHLVTMRATLQMVLVAGTAAPWVIQNQRDEIASFETVLESLKTRVQSMGEDERAALDDASTAMRKLRATRPLIPLTALRNRA